MYLQNESKDFSDTDVSSDSCKNIGFKLYYSSKKLFLNYGKHNNFTINQKYNKVWD